MLKAKARLELLKCLLLAGVAVVQLPITPVSAQADESRHGPDTAGQGSDMEIIVTARKRDETLISVPVAITAVTSKELSRSAINGIDALSSKVPGFIVGEGGGTVQGGAIALRGISAADSNPLGDQAVSFNIDGVQVARASIRRMGDYDLQKVEVLKGPQALFFGKNSPGGIISITTADPTDRFEAGGKLGYEFNADELRGEGYISGPLTDSLGARLAFFGSSMKGWVKNVVPATDPLAPDSLRAPDRDEYAFRGTMKFNNGGPFRARLKISHNHVKDNGMSANFQLLDCPTGNPFLGGPDDCKGNDRIVTGALGPDLANVGQDTRNPSLPFSRFGDGEPKSTSSQWLAGLEMNYDISDHLALTSVTGLYKLNFFAESNFSASTRSNAILAALNTLDIRELSQEVRLASSFDGPLNFLIGGQYQDTKADTAALGVIGVTPGEISIFGRPSPFVAANYFLKQKGSAGSIFGQLQFKPIERIEVSAGGRYSKERKELLSAINFGTQLVGTSLFLSNGNQVKTFNNFSPEASISYRPSRDLTVYVNYKHGFLSGGFNGGSFNAAGDLSYAPEKVKGWEGGVKGRTADGLLSAELALYSYKVTDLQVQVTTAGVVQELKNAGKVSSKGAEFSLSLRPAKGLSVYGNVAYADGKYDQYYATCYGGQIFLSPGTGIGQCASQPNPTNGNIVGVVQNLSGTELLRSPQWTGNTGFVYETPVSDAIKMELAGGVNFSSSYVANATSQPRSRSPKYAMLDGSIRLARADDRWEIALIGRNLTNKFYWTRSADLAVEAVNPTKLSDTIGVPSRGREVWVRVGFKY